MLLNSVCDRCLKWVHSLSWATSVGSGEGLFFGDAPQSRGSHTFLDGHVQPPGWCLCPGGIPPGCILNLLSIVKSNTDINKCIYGTMESLLMVMGELYV